jgi:hypothetical protein
VHVSTPSRPAAPWACFRLVTKKSPRQCAITSICAGDGREREVSPATAWRSGASATPAVPAWLGPARQPHATRSRSRGSLEGFGGGWGLGGGPSSRGGRRAAVAGLLSWTWGPRIMAWRAGSCVPKGEARGIGSVRACVRGRTRALWIFACLQA